MEVEHFLNILGAERRRLAFGPRKFGRFDFPSRIYGEMPFSVSQENNIRIAGHVLLNGCRRARVLFFKIGETGSLAPVQELADRLVVSHPCVFVADRNSEELEESLGRFGPDVGNDRGNLE